MTNHPVCSQNTADKFIFDDDDMDSDTVAESDIVVIIQIILAEGE